MGDPHDNTAEAENVTPSTLVSQAGQCGPDRRQFSAAAVPAVASASGPDDVVTLTYRPIPSSASTTEPRVVASREHPLPQFEPTQFSHAEVPKMEPELPQESTEESTGDSQESEEDEASRPRTRGPAAKTKKTKSESHLERVQYESEGEVTVISVSGFPKEMALPAAELMERMIDDRENTTKSVKRLPRIRDMEKFNELASLYAATESGLDEDGGRTLTIAEQEKIHRDWAKHPHREALLEYSTDLLSLYKTCLRLWKCVPEDIISKSYLLQYDESQDTRAVLSADDRLSDVRKRVAETMKNSLWNWLFREVDRIVEKGHRKKEAPAPSPDRVLKVHKRHLEILIQALDGLAGPTGFPLFPPAAFMRAAVNGPIWDADFPTTSTIREVRNRVLLREQELDFMKEKLYIRDSDHEDASVRDYQGVEGPESPARLVSREDEFQADDEVDGREVQVDDIDSQSVEVSSSDIQHFEEDTDNAQPIEADNTISQDSELGDTDIEDVRLESIHMAGRPMGLFKSDPEDSSNEDMEMRSSDSLMREEARLASTKLGEAEAQH
ncbi:hypothetical protein QBC37DRAFT_400835 [Rhypophila decipiens]|uniref:Uncharacterized protein n=1 Tax=Rhypophila decipiens TaxID=261697 RepID=A0AAN7B7N9_9PEZI|nr:hypothetical protein QBC37DRAFT_400835 [Rhypophila decipiens]